MIYAQADSSPYQAIVAVDGSGDYKTVQEAPKSLEIKELPPSPKISPNAIIRVKIGDPRATPATRSVLPVPAIKYVSTIL